MAGKKGIKGKAPPPIVYKAEDLDSVPVKKIHGLSKYTPELAQEICDHIANGCSLAKISRMEGMPTSRTVFKWLMDFPEFSLAYTRAREEQQLYYVDQMVEISDNESIPSDQKRVMIDARKWVASKLAPNYFGDKTTTVHTGPDGKPIQMQAVREVDVTSLDPMAREALKQALLKICG